MGLDMYLYRAEKNTAEWHNPQDEWCDCLDCRPKYEWREKGEIGYWRKANAIHGWFVNNLADGVDECQQIPVSVTDLLLLKSACEKVLANKPAEVPEDEDILEINGVSGQSNEEIAKAITDFIALQNYAKELSPEPEPDDPLAPQGGFFFGDTVKNEYYYEYVADTLGILTVALAETEFLDPDETLVYQASW
jgi:hypothetical protein